MKQVSRKKKRKFPKGFIPKAIKLARAKVKEVSGRDYESRGKCLKELGFNTYRQYLASDLWKEVRRKVYSLKGNNCLLCGEKASELHHNRYHKNDLTGRKTKFIYPVCHACHYKIEFKDGDKNTLQQAKMKFKKLQKAYKKSQADI